MPACSTMYQQHHSQQNHIYAKDHRHPGCGYDYNHCLDQDYDVCNTPGTPDQLLDYNHQWKNALASPSEESVKGFEPGSLVLTRQQIRDHNREVGWQQWITLKGIVYHTTGFRDHFIAYNSKKAREKQATDQTVGRPQDSPRAETLGEKQARDQQGRPVKTPQEGDLADALEQQGGHREKSALYAAETQAVDQRGALHEDTSVTADLQALKHCITDAQAEDQKDGECFENGSILTADADTLQQACDRLLRENAEEFDLTDIAAVIDSSNCTKKDSDMSESDMEADSHKEVDSDECDDEEDSLWQYDVIGALRKSGLSMSEIEQEIAPFKIGTLNPLPVPLWKYWESIRADVISVHDDITSRPGEEVSDYEREYLALLQQWLRKYRYMDPEERHPGGDGNSRVFFLMRDPDTLRGWIRTLPPVDTEIPECGAWECHQEDLLSPLPDTHNVFAASLRSHHSDHKLLSHEIHGDVAWRELPSDVIKDDVMTEAQQAVYEARARRGDSFWDPERMRKKRQQLGAYFMKKYSFSSEKMAQFLQWAEVMAKNEQELADLCRNENRVVHERETDL